MRRKLVAYFSASGTTRRAAERLAKAAGADLFEIKPAVPYTGADLNWTNNHSRSSEEMNDPASRPEIAEGLPNMADYDTVFIGFPIWWYVATRIISTFVESYDLSGKTVVPFATSGGSGMGRTVDELRKLCPNADWKAGKVVNGASDRALADWAKVYGWTYDAGADNGRSKMRGSLPSLRTHLPDLMRRERIPCRKTDRAALAMRRLRGAS